MKIDMHFHILGDGKDLNNIDDDVYLEFDDNHHWFIRVLSVMVEQDLKKMGADFNQDGKISTDEYLEFVYRVLTQSDEIDGIVLLGLDAVFSPNNGELDKIKTDLWVSNRFLSRKVKELNQRLQDDGIQTKGFFFGASVSPNRRDWESELDYVLNETDAVLIKWIPSVQHIHLMDGGHKDYYKTLADNNMPLLCHVGPEYAFPEGIRKRHLDQFRYLEKPLQYGVTVIAAHCATPVFPFIDENQTKEFSAFMKNANGGDQVKLWADTSALSLSSRISLIPEIVETFPPEWLVHGSDFPIPIDAWPHLPWVTHDMTPQEYIDIFTAKTPLDRDAKIKRAHGFKDSILENAEKVLRLRASAA